MVRRYADVVEVRTAVVEVRTAQAPAVFLWRGRLYVVREVLGHWREHRAWWAGSAARALHGDGGLDSAPAMSPGAALRPSTSAGDLGAEHEIWRVEASRGRVHPAGIYDLCQDVSAAAQGSAEAWRLLRVTD